MNYSINGIGITIYLTSLNSEIKLNPPNTLNTKKTLKIDSVFKCPSLLNKYFILLEVHKMVYLRLASK